METRDLAIKYKALHQAAELMIANIKEIGFDVSEYETVLKTIQHDVSDNVKVNYFKGFARANYEMDYSNGIAELNKLIARLDKYDVYFKVLNSCEWLNTRLQDSHISDQQLKEYVSEIAYNLKQIVKSDTMDYDNEKHIVEMVYMTAYNLIKLELMKTGNSQLYAYIKKEEINLSYFNLIIKKELSKLDLRDEKNTFLREKLFEVRKNGINSNYFDLDIIRGLLINDNNLFKDTINENMNNIVKNIEENTKKIKELVDMTRSCEYEKNYYKIDAEWNKKNIIKRFISFLIATSIMIGGGIGLQRLVKKESIKNKYNRTIEIYSTITDDTTTESDVIYLSDEPEEKTIVRVYDPYKNETKRDYQYYDVSYLDFDSLKEYYEYGTDNYGVVPQDGTLKTSSDDAISDYQNSYTEVIKSTYEYVGRELDKTEYANELVIGFLMYLLVLFVFERLYNAVTEPDYPTVIIGGIRELLEENKDLLSNKGEYNKYQEKITNNLNKIMELINKNDELRSEFDKLYNANKYLLDNPDELYNRIDQVVKNNYSEAAKKLIKENKNKR